MMRDLAMTSTNVLFLLGILLCFGRKMWLIGPCSQVRSLLAVVMHAIYPRGKDDIDETDAMVEARMQEMKLEHFRWVCAICALGMVPWSAWSVYNVVRGVPVLFAITVEQQLVAAVWRGVIALAACFPCTVTWRTIDAFYVSQVLAISVFVSPIAFTNADSSVLLLLSFNVPMFMLNMARRGFFVNLSLNVVYAVSFCGTVLVQGKALTLWPISACLIQFLYILVIAVCAHKAEMSMSTVIRQGLEFQAAKEALSAASAMLRSCCDVVVELDAKGTILSAARDLGAFLVRGPDQCLTGCMFEDLISHEADRNTFRTQLQTPKADDVGLAEAIHVRMRDANDNTLRVELLWFRFWHLPDQAHYMVGLREFSDVVSAKSTQHVEALPPVTANISTSECDEHSSVPDTCSSCDSLGEPPAIVAVDSLCNGLHLREVSTGFNLRIGRLSLGACLGEIVLRRREFCQWVQDGVNAALHGEDVPPCHVTLCFRCGHVQAQCRMLRSSSAEEDSQDGIDPDSVKLLFFDIKHNHPRGRPRRGAGSQEQRQLRGTPLSRLSL